MSTSCQTGDRVGVEFDDPDLGTNAGLFVPAAPAQHLRWREVVDKHFGLAMHLGAPAAAPGPCL